MDTLEKIKNIIRKFENDPNMETYKALDKVKDVIAEEQFIKKGEITKETYNVIMHDLECLDIPQTKSNKYHYQLLKYNLMDLFGVSNSHSVSELIVGEVYDRDELYKICDWFAEEDNVIFGSVWNNSCFRAEPDDIQKDKWCIKEYWSSD